MANQATRQVIIFIIGARGLHFICYSVPSPDQDESDGGNRDPDLAETYVGLPNLQ